MLVIIFPASSRAASAYGSVAKMRAGKTETAHTKISLHRIRAKFFTGRHNNRLHRKKQLLAFGLLVFSLMP
jgi:hypothetical protein